MAQIRRFNWLDDDLTASLNKANQGSIPSGRYYGFVWVDTSPSLIATFEHVDNGMTIIDSDSPITRIEGVGEWRTKQGGIIQETASITATFDAPGTLDRIDLLVGQHQYVQSVGGAVATYVVIKGIEGANPIAPSLTLPNEQTVLGQMYIPGGGVDLTDAKFTVAPKPDFGGDLTVAHLDRTQTFDEENRISQLTCEFGVCFLDVSNNRIDLSKDASGVALVGDTLRKNIKKNKFVLQAITATPTTITSIIPYPHEFSLEAKEIEIFTFSPLVLSGSLFYEHHFNPVQIPVLSSFKLLTIQDTLGSGTLLNTWKVINGGEATINGENKFTAINSWAKNTGSIGANDVVAHNDAGNFIEIPTTPSNKTIKGITGFNSDGGTFLAIKGDGEPLELIHDTADPVTKKLWLPHGRSFTSFSEDEVFLFVEDIDYWRLVGTYNQVDDWHYVGDATTGLGTTFADYSNTSIVNQLRFRKLAGNKVELKGSVNKNVLTNPLNTIVFNLPTGYIPSSFNIFSLACNVHDASSGVSLYTMPCQLTVNTSGTVFINAYTGLESLAAKTFSPNNVVINVQISLD